MADAAANQATVTGTLPLYKKPEPLSAQAHAGKGVKFSDRPFDFLKNTHFVPITIGEFGTCAGRYPIIFLGDKKTPVAAMGLRAGENLFVNEAGQFEDFGYLPAYVRRYPFVSASHSDDTDRFTICIDGESDLVSDQPDQPFFGTDGQPTAYTQNAIDYVKRFEADVASTNAFLKRMEELELFEEQKATFQPRDAQGNPQGEPQTVASYWGVSGQKLRALSPDVLVELRDNAYLGAIYAHMMSIPNWDALIQRATVRASQAAQNGAAAGAVPPPPEA
ncbi:SapC family protein [Woodsholea maritima]|uniref:SapC family protein n=1 Tax=Woodsholea maritima TaxID=240237 RepID=UPI0003643807|nr:SapC family protein [Woodsholea maritima]